MKGFVSRISAFWDPSAWILIALGIGLFSIRLPLEKLGVFDLPAAFTVLQTGGLMFAVFGMQLMASRAFWPSLSFSDAMRGVAEGQTSSALVVFGLLVFNGLCTIGFSYWLTAALGMASAR